MNHGFLYVTVFCTGLCVTAIELTASRFLAPFFGASIFVWANVIGVVLIALSLGYFTGGRLADRFPEPKKLFGVILITGILTDLIPLLGKPYLIYSAQLFSGSVPSIVFGSLLATLIIFALPLFLLGMMSPWVIRIATKRVEEVGHIAGKVYGISTVGSIIGVFIPVFLTIPFLGSQKTFLLFGSLLILIGILGLQKFRRTWIVFMVSILAFLFHQDVLKKDPFTIAQAETLYNYLRVNESPNKVRRLLVNEGRGVQSIYHPKKFLTGDYWDYATLLPILNPEGKKLLILGLAGGTSARAVSYYFPEILIDAVEIDPKIIVFGERYFELKHANLNIFPEDGRMFLKHSRKQYDFIMVDVYAQGLSIPFHMATVEFFEEVRNRLSENGIIMMNVATSKSADTLENPPPLVSRLKNTFSKVFSENRILKPEMLNWLLQPQPGSYLFFGTPRKNNSVFAMLPEQPPNDLPPELQTLFRTFKTFSKRTEHKVDYTFFTDDKSSIEWSLP